MRQPAATALKILVDAIPDAALRPLLLELCAASAAPSASADGHKLPDVTEPAPPAPATRRGWPRGKPRKTAAAGETAAERTARLARHATAQRVCYAEKRRARRAARAAQLGRPNGSNDNDNGSVSAEPAEAARKTPAYAPPTPAEPTLATRLWQRAAEVQPTAPWKAIVEEFGVHTAQAMNHCRNRTMPPIAAAAVTRFLEVSAS